MAAHFTPETIRFLRGLAKHNDRAWFEERRPIYERSVKTPMLAVIDEINAQLAGFAPEHVRPPHKVAMRIFRDTRFSPDKRPYKTHISAWWAREGLQKTAAAGFFLDIHPEHSYAAAGIYAPERDDLLLIRRWMADHHQRYRDLAGSLQQPAGTQAAMQPLDPNALTRNPKGFPPDHPAGDLLRARNWGMVAPFATEQAFEPAFPGRIVNEFRRLAPLVELLNEPFLQRTERSSGAVFPF